MKFAALCLAAGVLCMPSAGAAHDFWPPSVVRARYLMGTLCSVSVEAVDTTNTAASIETALDRVAALEQVMSSWRADSELSRFHSSATRGFTCSPDLFGALATARAWAETRPVARSTPPSSR